MTQVVDSTDPNDAASAYRTRRPKARTSLLAHGEPMVWLTGGALVVCITMIVSLLGLVVVLGLSTFWPGAVIRLETVQGKVLMGEVARQESYTPAAAVLQNLPAQDRPHSEQLLASQQGKSNRMLVRTGNFELTGEHFTWVSDFEVKPDAPSQPRWALLLERAEWGRFYGEPVAMLVDGQPVASEPEAVWAKFKELHPQIRQRGQERRRFERHDIGQVNHRLESARLARREVELHVGAPPAAWMQAETQRIAALETLERAQRERGDAAALQQAQQAYDDAASQVLAVEQQQKLSPHPRWLESHAQYLAVKQQADVEFDEIKARIAEINRENSRYVMTLATADGTNHNVELVNIVRAMAPNQLSFFGKLKVYFSRWFEFLFDEPREANSEGGVWPAIVGTVLMTIVMAIVVVPFGVLAALYLREYAKAGPIVSAVRIAVNNLAGVPSIVFGVFGLGFFCYIVGAYIDGGPQAAFNYQMPSLTWLGLLGALLVVVVIALLLMLASRVRAGQTTTTRQVAMRTAAMILWIGAAVGLVILVATVPFFDGLYRAKLADGSPTFRKGALVWASFTLALLTLPVVIVATEEALAAVPRSMREGSYACGASKWQTIQRIVLPRAMPGIMTGMILAMARGAGEVAPLMLVGAVKLAPELPLDTSWPFMHPERSFMHLGFHIFDLGFQSQNSEAAKPVVFTTTLLLILLVATLNLSAVWIRSRLRRKFVANQF